VLEKLKKHNTLYQVLNYYIQEHTYEEIAKLMGTTMGTVKSRLYQARKFVKENISEEFLANV
jgi:DNA-directed RNA polymerase specialized sigma24 family protein